jgi:death-on-curing protein
MTPDDIEYPSAVEIHTIHEGVVARDSETEPGTRTPEAVDSALTYISEGFFGERPETIHEKAAHLMRLIAADHPYVDGNKRTALGAAAYLYDLNGYNFQADDRVRKYLRAFATDADDTDVDAVIDYLREQATEKQ